MLTDARVCLAGGHPRQSALGRLTDGHIVSYLPPAGVATGSDKLVYVVAYDRGGVGAATVTVEIGSRP